MRTTPALLAAALATALTGMLVAPASGAAAPTQDLVLSKLDRGAPAGVPHLERDVIVDGNLRIGVPRNVVGLIGQSGDDYLVWAFSSGAGQDKVLRVSPDGSRRVVLRGLAFYDSHLSPDGTTLAVSNIGKRARTTIRTYDTTTGALTHQRMVRGFGTVLDFDGERVAVGVNSPNKTVLWSVESDGLTRVSGAVGYHADLDMDRLAVLTKDPYRGGCTVVSTFSEPDTTLWRSCRERVVAWSTDGSRMATVDLLADGLGPGRAWRRKAGGRLLGGYDSPYYFGAIGFEDETHVLMDTYSTSKYAVVRCDRGDCERASRTYPHSSPVLGARTPVTRVPWAR
ncbi:MAG: hypothetical protein ACR2JD_01500 [Nocardioides sp.]